MKSETKKQYIKSIFFTICPFMIPLIFMVPINILNKASQYIVVLLLLVIDIYFVLKISREEALLLYNSKNAIFDNKKYSISQSVLNRVSNCERIKGGFIKDETYKVHYDYNDNILLYNSHRYLERVCDEIKSLISDITKIELEYISVSFIYKYPHNSNDNIWDEWNWITGKEPTMSLNLTELINKPDSYYHYLISNDISTSFDNDKGKLIPERHYWAEERDKRHKEYGSISAHKMSFRNNNSTFCTSYLIISTYGKKFYSEIDNDVFSSEKEFEQILFDLVIPPFRKIIETELGFLYMRHKYREEKKKPQ